MNILLGVINDIIGKENYIDEEEIEINYSELEEEYKKTNEVMNKIDYQNLMDYFHDTIQLGLVKANNQWNNKFAMNR